MKLGSNDISAVKIGSTDVSKVYIGSTEVWSASSLLLDTYTGAAAAYSLRQLKSGVTNAIEVRRASDNTTQDIGFVDGELDTTSLTSFCSGTDGFVTTWYDQSGNGNDATQTTASSQPKIVSSGSVILENGKPALDFDGTDDTFNSGSFLNGLDDASIINVSTPTATNVFSNIYSGFDSFLLFNILYRYNDDSTIFVGLSGVSANANYSTSTSYATEQNLIFMNFDNSLTSGNQVDIYLNGSDANASGSNDVGTLKSPTNGYIGSRSGANNFYGNMQELIFYPSDQSSNQSGIETNINDFYSIYYVATNSEYQDVLDYADSQGYQRPSYAQQALQDALVGDLKDAGVWSKLDTFYVFATDGDRDFAAINWKDPNNYEITEVNSPTFTTDVGFTGNGTSNYLDPSYNQGTDGVNWSDPNGSFGVWVDTAATTNSHSYVGYAQTTSTLRRGGIKIINTIQLTVDGNVNDTFMHININSTNAELFYNGSSQGTQTGTFSNTDSMTFLAEGGTTRYSNATISIGFFGGDLSSEQGDFYTAVNSYMTSI